MMIDEIIAKAKGFIFSPVESFQGARADDTNVVAPYLIALLLFDAVLTSVISFLGISVMGMFTQAVPGFAVPVVIFFCVLIGDVIATVIFSLWLHLWVYIVGGRKGIMQTVKAVVYGATPGMLLGWIPLAGFLFTLWSIFLMILGVRELQDISSGRALLVMIIAVMVPLVLLILIALYFMVNVSSFHSAPVAPGNMLF